jgi:hypothetical protein
MSRDARGTPFFARGRALLAGVAAAAMAAVVGPSAGVTAALAAPAPAAAPAAARVSAAASPVVGLAAASTRGYWQVTASGAVLTEGTARYYGSLAGRALRRPAAGIVGSYDARGYWIFTQDGKVYAFGDARFHGDFRNPPAAPVVGMAASLSGNGYWLVTSTGGVYTYGDARYRGWTGRLPAGRTVVAITRTRSGNGYYLLRSDGVICTYGDARYRGSAAGGRLGVPAAAVAVTPSGNGYLVAVSNGQVYAFGDGRYRGSAVAFDRVHGRTVGIVAVGPGYWLPTSSGVMTSMDVPAPGVAPARPAPPRLPAARMPSASRAPSLAFEKACWILPANVATCNSAALSEIDAARAAEGYGPLALPSGFATMPVAAQVIAVANAERTSRGLPALPESTALDGLAQLGAVAGRDPSGPANYGWSSNIAWGDPTALAADYSWMYDDGPDSENIDCAPYGSGGCWGHRMNILSPWSGRSGAGAYFSNGQLQLTELFVENY